MTDWPHVRLKYVAGLNERTLPETAPEDLAFRYVDISTCGRGVLTGEPEWMVFGEAPSRARRLVRAGDTIVSTVRTYLRAVWPVSGPTEDLVASTGFAVLSPSDGLDAEYLGWLMQSDPVIEEIVARSVGVSYPAINAVEIGEIRVPCPPQAAQCAIAGYLDTETARIGRMVQMLHRLRTLLEDRWNHVLDDEVLGRTSGREPFQGMKSSGPFASAVGKWPADWTPQPLKRVLVANQSGVWGGDPTGNEDTVVLRSTDISINGAWTITDPATRSLSVLDAHSARLRVGDIVVVTSSGSEQHIGKAALVDGALADLGAAFSNFTQRLTTSKAADPRYVWYLLRSPFGREQLRWLSSTTTGLRNLSGRVLGAVTYPGPPLSEQRRIVSALDEVRSDLDKIAGGLDRQIDLLMERRQALITAAVTGQLHMPGSPPD